MRDVKIRKCLVNVKKVIPALMFLIITNPVQSRAEQSERRSAGVNQPEESQNAATPSSC